MGNSNTRVKAATAEELLLDSVDEDFPSLELFLELFLEFLGLFLELFLELFRGVTTGVV